MDIFCETFAPNEFFTHKLWCACTERVYYAVIICLKCFASVVGAVHTRLVRNNDLLILLLKINTIVFAGKSQVPRREKNNNERVIIINDIFSAKQLDLHNIILTVPVKSTGLQL